MPIAVRSLFLVPWIYHRTHARFIGVLSFQPIRVDSADIIATANAARPVGVPADDLALAVTERTRGTTVLWYDPCTFVVDAYDNSATGILRRLR